MNIYKHIGKELERLNATPAERRKAFIALSVSGLHCLRYLDKLKEKRQAAEIVERYEREAGRC